MGFPYATDPTSNVNELLYLFYSCGLTLRICEDYEIRSKEPSPPSLQQIHSQIRELQDVVRKVVEIVEPDAFKTWPYISSWNLDKRSGSPMTTCQRGVDDVHTLLKPVSRWKSPDKCPKFSEGDQDLEKSLKIIKSLKDQLVKCLESGNGSKIPTLTAVEELRSLVDRALDFTRPYVQSTADEKERVITAWMGGSDHSNHLIDSLECVKSLDSNGIGNGIVTSQAYREWKSNTDTSLFLKVVSRIDSSLLCATIIYDLQSTVLQHGRVAVAYYFYDHVYGLQETFCLSIRSLIFQLTAQLNTFPVTLSKHGARHMHITRNRSSTHTSQPKDAEFMEMLKEMISEFSEVYLVLDSIDSCTAPTKLLDFIDELSKWRQGHLHLLTANSSDPLFAEKLLESANTEICVGHLPPNFKANIVNQLELLRSQGGVSVEKVLAWITMAPCPLKLEEVQAIARETNMESQETDHIITSIEFESLLEHLKDFVTVTSVSPSWSAKPGVGSKSTKAIRLAAHPIREIVMKHLDAVRPVEDMSTEQFYNHEVAKSCLEYLLDMDVLETENDLLKYPLAKYAARNWTTHFKNGGGTLTSDTPLYNLALQLLDEKSHQYKNWSRLWNPESPLADPDLGKSTFISPLYWMIFLGFDGLVQGLLNKGSDPDCPGPKSSWDDCLSAASGLGLSVIVQKLLTAGAKHKYKNIYWNGPLTHGVNYPDCVEILLQFDLIAIASYPITNEDYARSQYMSRAVLKAVSIGNADTVKRLLAAGADPNVGVNKMPRSNPLQAAVLSGDSAIVELLIPEMKEQILLEALRHLTNKEGRDTKAIVLLFAERYPGVALHYAAKFGWLDIVKDMVARGAPTGIKKGSRYGDWNEKDTFESLTAAAEGGFDEIVQLLLEHGTLKEQENVEDDALQAAALKGHEGIVRQLLQAGAITTKTKGYHGGAFHAAVQNGHLEIVKLLLHHGVDVNFLSVPNVSCSDPACFGTAIQAAAYKGNEEMVSFLLDCGADINSSSDNFPSALQCAIVKGHMAMVKLLLQKGADIEQNTCGYAKFHSDKFGKPIHCAIETEDVEMVKLLITAGADVNAYSERNRTRTTPLSRAVHSNNKEIVLLLLQSGADTTAVGHFIGHINLYGGERWHQRPSDGETALELACSSGYLDIVKILVEYGANVDQQGACGWTALHCAAYQAHDDTLSYLLHDAKASTNLVLSNNCTPFHALMMSMFKRERFYKCADIMLNAGFDINAKSDVGTALHLASYRAEMIVYLLSNGADPSITNNEGQKPLDMMMLKAKGVTFTTYNYEEAIMVLEEVNAKMEDWTLV